MLDFVGFLFPPNILDMKPVLCSGGAAGSCSCIGVDTGVAGADFVPPIDVAFTDAIMFAALQLGDIDVFDWDDNIRPGI